MLGFWKDGKILLGRFGKLVELVDSVLKVSYVQRCVDVLQMGRTYRSNIAKASDGTVSVGVSRRSKEVDEPSQDQEWCGRFRAGVCGQKLWPGSCVGDSSEFTDVAATAQNNQNRNQICRKPTYVSFTPQILGHSMASSVMRSESRSMPPDAPGSI